MRRLSRRQRLAAIALALVALAFLTLDIGGSSLSSAHGGVRGAFGSLYRGTDSVLGPIRRFVQGVPGAASNQDRINQLEADDQKLRQQLADAAVDKATAAQLKVLRLSARSGGYRMVAARVTALSPGQGFEWTVTLDAGASSGVRIDQTVTDGYGLVGRVVHADESSSVVLLAVDPGSGVGVRDLRSGQLGVAKGAGTDGFSFTPLDPESRVAVGDRLATGPAGSSSYVPGVALGTVRSVRVSRDGSTTATVEPETSPTGMDLVGVIIRSGSSDSGVQAGHR
jgi:rod shape-determining protein MreC